MTTTENVQLPQKWANPAVLRWARLQMGLKPPDVATQASKHPDKAEIPAERVTAWEQAREAPALADLEVLADIYDCPVGYFFLDSPPDVRLPLELRGLAQEKVNSLTYETHLHLREFLHLVEYSAFLLESLGVPWQVRIDAASLGESVQNVANRERQRFGFTSAIRQQWSTYEDAFDFWRSAIEDRGVFVIALRLNPQQVRGASTWVTPRPPAILVNRADSEAASGRTFTLLHEWAHLLTKAAGVVCDFRGHQNGTRLEHFANTFAAEVLAPKTEVEQFLGTLGLLRYRERWGDTLLDRIRAPFKISRDVVAILLENMQLAPTGFYRAWRAARDQRTPFGRGGKRPTKEQLRREELGTPLVKLLAQAHERGTVSKLELAELLDMKVEKAERFVAWVREEAGQPSHG